MGNCYEAPSVNDESKANAESQNQSSNGPGQTDAKQNPAIETKDVSIESAQKVVCEIDKSLKAQGIDVAAFCSNSIKAIWAQNTPEHRA